MTVPFEKVIVGAGSTFTDLNIGLKFPLGKTLLVGEPTQDWWSFYVWYMDRNRPLPPGGLFDLYRQKDYEKRKAEGFSPPLFKSTIETREWICNTGEFKRI